MERLEDRAVPAVFVVTNDSDSFAGSLRGAINTANSAPGPDTILFNIEGGGSHTIALHSQLPNIIGPLTIDGWSQPGFTNRPLIEISAGASDADSGLNVFASDSLFRGLIMNGFVSSSIAIREGSGNQVQGCYLGSNAAGTALVGESNLATVYLAPGVTDNIVGTNGDGVNDALEGNLIVGSSQVGVWLNGAGTTNNRVAGNRIGSNAAGTGLGNLRGVLLSDGAQRNVIGSNNDGVSDWLETNHISGNYYSGIAVTESNTLYNRISRNLVHGNENVEIDLADDGVDTNDPLDRDAGPNTRVNFPILRSLAGTATTTTVSGAINARAYSTYRLEFFASAAHDNQASGSAQRYLGAATVRTNYKGTATFTRSFNTTLPYGWVVSSTTTDGQGNTSEFSPAVWAGANLGKTFQLHSNPTATKTVYLDFNGHTTTGTLWNSLRILETIASPAYSIDGNAAFSEQELFNIQRMFYAVAEDFRPFNINVTTQQPPLADLMKDTSGTDTRWGIRVAIGGSETSVLGSGDSGGLGFYSSFNWSNDTPCFVFEDALQSNGPQAVAVATSHEVGHTLGLDHDGTGTLNSYYSGHGSGPTSWGTIMGAPYGRSVSQWSRGTYTAASNTQDDLAMIVGSNGFSYRPDDFGNTLATAASLTLTAGRVVQTGVISRANDVDLFRFTTTGGKLDLTASPDVFDPNLDIQLQLLNAAGQVLATSNPGAQLGARIAANVPAGTYFLRIDGVGVGNPLAANPTGYTDYGSLGYYAIAGTIPGNAAPQLGLGGTIGYTRNSAVGVVLVSGATVTDPDSKDFFGGTLSVSITSGAEDANRLTFTGGAFTLSGDGVLYHGLRIGTLTSNGTGRAALSVLLNVQATPSIAQLLVRNIRFSTISSSSNAQRLIAFSLSDGDGGTSNTAIKTVKVTS